MLVVEATVSTSCGRAPRSQGCAHAGARSPAWALNGRELTFERSGKVYIANRDGSGQRPAARGELNRTGRRTAASSSPRATVDRGRAGTERAAKRDGGTRGRGAGVVSERQRRSRSRERDDHGRARLGSRGDGDRDRYAACWSPIRLAWPSRPGGIASVDTCGPRRAGAHARPRTPRADVLAGRLRARLRGGETLYALPLAGGEPRPHQRSAGEWAVVPTRVELLPDLDQRAPANLVVSYMAGATGSASPRRWTTSARPGLDPRGPQRSDDAGHPAVRTRGGGAESHRRGDASLHGVVHAHALAPARLRALRASARPTTRSSSATARPACLADHYGQAPGVRASASGLPRQLRQRDASPRSVEQGSSRTATPTATTRPLPDRTST